VSANSNFVNCVKKWDKNSPICIEAKFGTSLKKLDS